MHKTHTLWEKTLFRTGIYGAYLVGILAVILKNPVIGIVYAAAAALLLRVVFLRFCSHCPYPCEHSDCLMAPNFMIKQIIQPSSRPMKFWERWSFPVVMIGAIPLFAQYWLIQSPALLILFWVLMLGTALGFRFHMCRSCLFSACPLNVTGNGKKWLGIL